MTKKEVLEWMGKYYDDLDSKLKEFEKEKRWGLWEYQSHGMDFVMKLIWAFEEDFPND